MSGAKSGMSERLLTVAEAADVLRTSERFPRRLIAERRIRFVRVGRHVRIPESALREFITAGLVEPVTVVRTRRRKVALWPGNGASAGSAACPRAAGRPVTRDLIRSTVPRRAHSLRKVTLNAG